jgi:type VI protein secretion system component Hcp
MRRIALSCFILSATAAFAGNMSLMIDTLPTVPLTGFSTGASNTVSPVGGGGGVGKVIYKEFAFKATQSAVTPTLVLFTSNGKRIPSARVQVRGLDNRLAAEWVLSDVAVSAVEVVNGEERTKNSNLFYLPEIAFNLQFAKYCYKVFAANGITVASEMCWDLNLNKPA